MKALIIDDECLARRELRQLLSAHPLITAIAEARDVADALAITQSLVPDVVFLDVQLRGETGFDFLERVGPTSPAIVMVTAFDQYAIKSFEYAALDYLLKPVGEARLAATLDRVAARVSAGPNAAPGFAVLKQGTQVRLVPWRAILRISSAGNYTRVYLRDGSDPLVLRTLKEWQTLVPPSHFVQVHRTCLVRRDDIVGVGPADRGHRSLLVSDGTLVPVGRLYWHELKRTLAP